MKEKIKQIVNSIPIPPLLSFFISKKGKINPSWEEIKADAPKENWNRLNMDKYYPNYLMILVILFLRLLSAIIGFIIEIISKIQTLNFDGQGSILNITYKAQAVLYFVNNSFWFLGFVAIVLLTIKIFKKQHF